MIILGNWKTVYNFDLHYYDTMIKIKDQITFKSCLLTNEQFGTYQKKKKKNYIPPKKIYIYITHTSKYIWENPAVAEAA